MGKGKSFNHGISYDSGWKPGGYGLSGLKYGMVARTLRLTMFIVHLVFSAGSRGNMES